MQEQCGHLNMEPPEEDDLVHLAEFLGDRHFRTLVSQLTPETIKGGLAPAAVDYDGLKMDIVEWFAEVESCLAANGLGDEHVNVYTHFARNLLSGGLRKRFGQWAGRASPYAIPWELFKVMLFNQTNAADDYDRRVEAELESLSQGVGEAPRDFAARAESLVERICLARRQARTRAQRDVSEAFLRSLRPEGLARIARAQYRKALVDNQSDSQPGYLERLVEDALREHSLENRIWGRGSAGAQLASATAPQPAEVAATTPSSAPGRSERDERRDEEIAGMRESISVLSAQVASLAPGVDAYTHSRSRRASRA